jgi:8-oxo-dGTP pyrophosphatase MutT (NUDIX family)
MKGKKNWAAAAQEAREEAGVIGKTQKQPVGAYNYLKRRASQFDLCRVEVYLLAVEKRLESFREKGQRDIRWFPIEEAAEAVHEPGLTELLSEIDLTSFRKPAKSKPSQKPDKKKRKKT